MSLADSSRVFVGGVPEDLSQEELTGHVRCCSHARRPSLALPDRLSIRSLRGRTYATLAIRDHFYLFVAAKAGHPSCRSNRDLRHPALHLNIAGGVQFDKVIPKRSQCGMLLTTGDAVCLW